jgi:hypothetical protein
MRTLDLDLKVGEEERNQEEVGADREDISPSEALPQILLEGGPDLEDGEGRAPRWPS